MGSDDETAFRLHSFGVKWKGDGSRSHCGPGIVIEALRPYGCVVVVRRVRRETVDDIDDPISNYPILSSSVGWWTYCAFFEINERGAHVRNTFIFSS